MEVIEDVEEGVLAAGTYKILDVVHDKDVYLHIEREEVGEFVSHAGRIHILGLEFVSGDVKNRKVRILFLHGISYRLSQMSLS